MKRLFRPKDEAGTITPLPPSSFQSQSQSSSFEVPRQFQQYQDYHHHQQLESQYQQQQQQNHLYQPSSPTKSRSVDAQTSFAPQYQSSLEQQTYSNNVQSHYSPSRTRQPPFHPSVAPTASPYEAYVEDSSANVRSSWYNGNAQQPLDDTRPIQNQRRRPATSHHTRPNSNRLSRPASSHHSRPDSAHLSTPTSSHTSSLQKTPRTDSMSPFGQPPLLSESQENRNVGMGPENALQPSISRERPNPYSSQFQHQSHNYQQPINRRLVQQPPPNQYSPGPISLRHGQMMARQETLEPIHSSGPVDDSHIRHSNQSVLHPNSSHSNDTSSYSGHSRSSDDRGSPLPPRADIRSYRHQNGDPRKLDSLKDVDVGSAPIRSSLPPPSARPRTESASHSSTTPYPSYSGGSHTDDDGSGEVLISQGRYEETTLSEQKDKDKGRKKLFGFSTGSKDKDKKSRQDRDLTIDARQSASRSNEAIQPSPLEPSPGDKPKEAGWMDKWNKRAQQHVNAKLQDKEVEALVASKIGWLSANANTEGDWMQILPLIDMVTQSEAASKEAAKTLRKEFKLGSVDTQRRAVRIWALLTLNSNDRFRFQVATKRFLDGVEDMITSSKTPLSVKDTTLRVLGVLAFEFRDDPELASITKCWNKVKPSDRPKNGEPLENDLFEFRLPQAANTQPASPFLPTPEQGGARQMVLGPPEGRRASDPYDQSDSSYPRHRQKQRSGPRPHTMQQLFHPSIASDPPASGQQRSFAVPLQQEHDLPRHHQFQNQQMQPMGSDAQPILPPREYAHQSQAPPSAQVTGNLIVQNLESLAETEQNVGFAPPLQEGPYHTTPVIAPDEDIRRLHQECQIGQSNASVLMDTVLHEGITANTEELVGEFYAKVMRSQELIGSQIPWASAQADRSRESLDGHRNVAASEGRPMPAVAGETREERLLADLLETHGRLTEASNLVAETRRRMDEEEEERRVTERSKVEVRLDRSALAQDSGTGNLYDMAHARAAYSSGLGTGNGMLDANHGSHAHASGSRSPSPNVQAHLDGQPMNGSMMSTSSSSVPSSLTPGGTGSNLTSPTPSVNTGRVSRPLPIPRSEPSQSSDTSSLRSSHFQPSSTYSASQASRQSLNHSVTSHGSLSHSHSQNSHSRNASNSSQRGSGHLSTSSTNQTRTLPLTPPMLNVTTSQLSSNQGTASQRGEYADEEDDLQTPIVPSEKALGKRRAVSIRHSSPPVPPEHAMNSLQLGP